MKIQIQAIASHHNGVHGAPFHVALFTDEDNRPMLAIVFEENCHCAVLHRDQLATGDIAFGSNSWRGDWYEPPLRKAIMAYESGQISSDGVTDNKRPDFKSQTPQERITVDEDQ